MTQAHHYEIGIDDHRDVYDIVIRDNGNIIAVLSSGEGPAQHLVKAGNCHDELLEALKKILEDAEAISYHTPHLGGGYFDKARAAIAKAEGRE